MHVSVHLYLGFIFNSAKLFIFSSAKSQFWHNPTFQKIIKYSSLTHLRWVDSSTTILWTTLDIYLQMQAGEWNFTSLTLFPKAGFLVGFYYLTPVFNANNVDPDQKPHSAVSDLGLHCLPITLLEITRLKWVNNEVLFVSFQWPSNLECCWPLIGWVKLKDIVIIKKTIHTISMDRWNFTCISVSFNHQFTIHCHQHLALNKWHLYVWFYPKYWVQACTYLWGPQRRKAYACTCIC